MLKNIGLFFLFLFIVFLNTNIANAEGLLSYQDFWSYLNKYESCLNEDLELYNSIKQTDINLINRYKYYEEISLKNEELKEKITEAKNIIKDMHKIKPNLIFKLDTNNNIFMTITTYNDNNNSLIDFINKLVIKDKEIEILITKINRLNDTNDAIEGDVIKLIFYKTFYYNMDKVKMECINKTKSRFVASGDIKNQPYLINGMIKNKNQITNNPYSNIYFMKNKFDAYYKKNKNNNTITEVFNELVYDMFKYNYGHLFDRDLIKVIVELKTIRDKQLLLEKTESSTIKNCEKYSNDDKENMKVKQELIEFSRLILTTISKFEFTEREQLSKIKCNENDGPVCPNETSLLILIEQMKENDKNHREFCLQKIVANTKGTDFFSDNGMLKGMCMFLGLILGSFGKMVITIATIGVGWLFLVGKVTIFGTIVPFVIAVSFMFGSVSIANLISRNGYNCEMINKME